MAGRGRGKATGTLTQEQLQSLGVTSKEIQAVTSAAPPPLYPPLLSKPVPLESNPDRNYKILWKEDFISYLKESAYYITKKPDQHILETDTSAKREADFFWKLMPAELKPTYKRITRTGGPTEVKRLKPVDINAKLSALEKKETTDGRLNVKKEKQDSDDDKEEEPEEEMADEEMDDENDYGNNYFDNGEAYNDEDDNMDDGPIY